VAVDDRALSDPDVPLEEVGHAEKGGVA
jgi:hypothetical protein